MQAWSGGDERCQQSPKEAQIYLPRTSQNRPSQVPDSNGKETGYPSVHGIICFWRAKNVESLSVLDFFIFAEEYTPQVVHFPPNWREE